MTKFFALKELEQAQKKEAECKKERNWSAILAALNVASATVAFFLASSAAGAALGFGMIMGAKAIANQVKAKKLEKTIAKIEKAIDKMDTYDKYLADRRDFLQQKVDECKNVIAKAKEKGIEITNDQVVEALQEQSEIKQDEKEEVTFITEEEKNIGFGTEL